MREDYGIIYLFIYTSEVNLFCGKDIRGVGRGAEGGGEVGFKRGWLQSPSYIIMPKER